MKVKEKQKPVLLQATGSSVMQVSHTNILLSSKLNVCDNDQFLSYRKMKTIIACNTYLYHTYTRTHTLMRVGSTCIFEVRVHVW